MQSQGQSFPWREFLDRVMIKDEDFPPSYIILHTDDHHKLELLCCPGFEPLYVPEILKPNFDVEIIEERIPRTWHLAVHGQVNSGTPTCVLNGLPIIQLRETASAIPSIFNSIYWPRCDGTYQNALGRKLLENGKSRPKTHRWQELQLKNLLVPQGECVTWTEALPSHNRLYMYRTLHRISLYGDPDWPKKRYNKDVDIYEMFKDCFVERIG